MIANPPIPFEAFDPEFPNQPLEQSRFAGITPERQAVNTVGGEVTLPREDAAVPGMVPEFMDPNMFFDPPDPARGQGQPPPPEPAPMAVTGS